MQAPHIVLLGATGFIGRAIVKQVAREDGSRRVSALIHRTRMNFDSNVVRPFYGSATALPAGLLADEPHVVIHCGSKQIDHDGCGFSENERGIEALCAAVNPHTRGILFASSYSVYGDGPLRGVSEDCALQPQSELARSRVACEERLKRFAESGTVSVAVLRARFVIGRGDRHFLPGLLKLARRRVALADQRQAFSVIDVDDYARVLLEMARRCSIGDAPTERFSAFNVGYERAVSLAEILEIVREIFQVDAPRWRIPVRQALLRTLERLPSPQLRQIVHRIRLLGQDQYGATGKLSAWLGQDWLRADPLLAVRRATIALLT